MRIMCRSTPVIALSLALTLCSACALADDHCAITSDKQQLNFGRFRSDEMQHGSSDFSGRTVDWRTVDPREFHLSVTCDTPQRIRLFVDAPLQPGHWFRFSEAGAMTMTFKSATIDNQAVMLKAVARGQNTPVEGGAAEWKAIAGQGVGFTRTSELAGTHLEVTLQIKPYLLPVAFSSRDISLVEESMLASIETRPATTP